MFIRKLQLGNIQRFHVTAQYCLKLRMPQIHIIRIIE